MKLNLCLSLFFLISIFSSCGSNADTSKNFEADTVHLNDHTWELASWEKDGEAYQNQFMETCTILFDNHAKKLQGSDGCNAFSATYNLEGNMVSSGPIAGTKKYCGEESSKDEQAFHEVLSSFEITALDDEKLVIKHGSQILIFKSK